LPAARAAGAAQVSPQPAMRETVRFATRREETKCARTDALCVPFAGRPARGIAPR
jgi:hypothetical protein